MERNASQRWSHGLAVRRWCDELLNGPIERQQICWCNITSSGYPARMRAHKGHPIDTWARDGRGAATFVAQHGQDWWLMANFIRDRFSRPGTYVDLATNDPIYRSSTFFLDACLGWRGACVEANPAHYYTCLLYTSPSPRDGLLSRMPSSA